MKTLHILIGLPGSGKTTWSDEFVKANDKLQRSKRETINRLDCDSRGGDAIKFLPRYINDSSQHFIIDSLATTNESIKTILSTAFENKITFGFEKIILHVWNSDRETCEWNDRGRRNVNSTISIQNMVFDTIDASLIQEHVDTLFSKPTKVSVEIEKHYVIRKPEWKVFSDEFVSKHLHVDSEGYARSGSWSLGGTWCDCWGGTGSVSSDPQPEFTEFDSIIEDVCPDISFMKYKKLYNSCVSTDDNYDHDYYGGSTTNAFYKLNVKALYDELRDNNIYTV